MTERGDAGRPVFVCHSSRDAQFAQDVVAALESRGVSTWIAPRDVESGENYPKQLVKAISSCRVFMILVTESSCASDHVLRELEVAAKQGRSILPVMVEQVASDDIDYYLGAIHRIEGPPNELVALTAKYFTQNEISVEAQHPSSAPMPSTRPETGPIADASVTSLRIGLIPFPPFSEFAEGPGSCPSGYYVQLLNKMAASANVTLEYRTNTHENTIDSLRDGDIDVIACLYRTPRRMQLFDFAACFFASTVGAIVRADDKRILSQGDLMRDDIRIVVCKGEVGSELAQDQFGAKHGSRRLIEVDTVEVSNIAGLVAGGVADVAITDNMTCKLSLRENGGNLRHAFSDFPLFVGHIGLVIAQNRPALRELLNTGLSELRKSESCRRAESALLADYPGMLQTL